MAVTFPELPPHLAQNRAMGGCPGEPVAQFEIGSARNFYYLIIDWPSKQAALVDAPKDLAPVLEFLEEHDLKLSRVLLTHSHWDHVPGVPELAQRFPEVPIHLHPEDSHRMKGPTLPVRDDEVFTLGQSHIRVLHTPGHSAGEVCYLLEGERPHLCTGDTVFIRDCGRTDLESGSVSAMFNSLQKLKELPGHTVILPGHHYATECASTLARELQESPPFRCKNVQELEALP